MAPGVATAKATQAVALAKFEPFAALRYAVFDKGILVRLWLSDTINITLPLIISSLSLKYNFVVSFM